MNIPHLDKLPSLPAPSPKPTPSASPPNTSIPKPVLFTTTSVIIFPSIARWLSRDPIEEKGGLNLYVFVGNDGIGTWDLLGFLATLSPDQYSELRRKNNRKSYEIN